MMSIFKVKVNYLTYIYVLLFLFSGYKKNLTYIFIVFIVHEFGHLFFCKLFNIKIQSIEIYPFGGIIKIDNLINFSILKKFLISSGGLIFQLLLLFIQNNTLFYYNKLIFCLNILPILPLDGSKVLQNILFNFFSYYKSVLISYIASVITLIIIIFYSNNYFLLIFSLSFLIKDIYNFSFIFNKFLLERYMYDFHFKKSKYYKHVNLKKLQINKLGYFYEYTWKNEKYFLSKIFDKKG